MDKILKNMLKKPINAIFVFYLAVVFLIAFGILPRQTIFLAALLVIIFVIIDNLENATLFFARTIPFFVALPISDGFDSLNLWRIISGVIFLKWAFKTLFFKNVFTWTADFFKKPVYFLKNHLFVVLVLILLLLALLSLLPAQNKFIAVKRVVYFINLSLIGMVIFDLAKSIEFVKKLLANLAIPLVLVLIVGFGQLISTYFLDINSFMNFWADRFQLSFYGGEWSSIVKNFNTWFAYYGNQLSLRMFSTFPDTHSFPIYLLLSFPAVFATFFSKKIFKDLKNIFKLKMECAAFLILFAFLAIILSGTRGMWLAAIPTFLLALLIWKSIKELLKRKIISLLLIFFILFFLLFSIAYPIFASPQFRVSKEDSGILLNRIKSMLSLDEKSNSGRIFIWKETFSSILKNPLLGVGIGNFPVVLKEDILLARAGSSAHNLYLNIASEMGIAAMIISFLIVFLIMKKGFLIFRDTIDNFLRLYGISAFLFFFWVFFYSLTDATLFDERAFLIFVVNIGLVLGLNKKPDLG